MTNELKVIATLVAKAGSENELRQLLLPAVDAFRQEPGCHSYALLEDRQHVGKFVTFETWSDEDALAKHMASPAMKALTPQLKDLLQGDISQTLLSILVDQ